MRGFDVSETFQQISIHCFKNVISSRPSSIFLRSCADVPVQYCVPVQKSSSNDSPQKTTLTTPSLTESATRKQSTRKMMMQQCALAMMMSVVCGFVSTPLTTPLSLKAAPVDEVVEDVVAPEPEPEPVWDAKSLPGVSGPFGFFDPLGFSQVSKERMLYFREAELKHARVAMLAAAGFPIAEKFHPLFGGHVDVPSYVAFQATPLQTFWPVPKSSFYFRKFFH